MYPKLYQKAAIERSNDLLKKTAYVEKELKKIVVQKQLVKVVAKEAANIAKEWLEIIRDNEKTKRQLDILDTWTQLTLDKIWEENVFTSQQNSKHYMSCDCCDKFNTSLERCYTANVLI